MFVSFLRHLSLLFVFVSFSGSAPGSSSSASPSSCSCSGRTSGWRRTMTTTSSTGEGARLGPRAGGNPRVAPTTQRHSFKNSGTEFVVVHKLRQWRLSNLIPPPTPPNPPPCFLPFPAGYCTTARGNGGMARCLSSPPPPWVSATLHS